MRLLDILRKTVKFYNLIINNKKSGILPIKNCDLGSYSEDLGGLPIVD